MTGTIFAFSNPLFPTLFASHVDSLESAPFLRLLFARGMPQGHDAVILGLAPDKTWPFLGDTRVERSEDDLVHHGRATSHLPDNVP